MVLTLVGLGLNDERDVSIRGLEAIRAADILYLENYTATLNVDTNRLERFFEKPIILADRDFVEGSAEAMLEAAKTKRVACLVVGDPFCATTHSDLYLRARDNGVTVKVIHNASIMSAVAACGLQLYRFGETVSIPFFDGGWKPVSFYEKIQKNRENNMHTLCLLDIKVKEQTVENLMKGNNIFEPPRFMTVNTAIKQLFEAAEMRGDEGVASILAFGLARVGADDQAIVSGSLQELLNADLGGPLHSLVLCAPELHEIEQKFVSLYSARNSVHTE
ncbi:diphthine synthase, putative [Eimeria necatrix]|uniref:diphthine methyl ester synthase n=1 Tax=Eimeria necatrix TaxID=51315 RepID=U6MP97_9EIME|nr:diphthine synthase, putative [Eimeria necatrix]CDJ65841.1 diphthine synthase, putative [Eimeria necatrix]